MLFRDPNGLGGGRGLTARRRAVHRQHHAVRIAIFRGRYRAIADAVLDPAPARIAAEFSAPIQEIQDFRALRRRDGEFIVLILADIKRAGDGELLRQRRAKFTGDPEHRLAAAGYDLTGFRRLAVHGNSRRLCQTFAVQFDCDPIVDVLKHVRTVHCIEIFRVRIVILPRHTQNVAFAEGDAQVRGFKGERAIAQFFARLEIVDRDGEGRRHRRAEVTAYTELLRHAGEVWERTIIRCVAVNGDNRHFRQAVAVQINKALIARASLERIIVCNGITVTVSSVFIPPNILNIVFAEGDAWDRGFHGDRAVVRRVARHEAVDRDGEAALHLIDGVKGQVAAQIFDFSIGRIDRPGAGFFPAHEFVGRAVLDGGEAEAPARRDDELIGACLRVRAVIGARAVLEILRDHVVSLRKGRHRAEHQHHAKGKQDA